MERSSCSGWAGREGFASQTVLGAEAVTELRERSTRCSWSRLLPFLRLLLPGALTPGCPYPLNKVRLFLLQRLHRKGKGNEVTGVGGVRKEVSGEWCLGGMGVRRRRAR